jgi:H+-translocating NAD(P) transhydrogenase subunit beta
MSGFTGYIQLVYVLAAALFVVGLHLMNSPATARRGNQVSMTGMIIAVISTTARSPRRAGSCSSPAR